MSTPEENEILPGREPRPQRHKRPHIPTQPLDDLAAQAIRELEARGEWHLPGKGKPLRLIGDLSDRATMSAKVRGDAGFAAPWEDVAREIDLALRDARLQLKRAFHSREAALNGTSRKRQLNVAAMEADWQRASSLFEKQIGACNSLILKFNLLIPPQVPQLHRPRLRVESLLHEMGLSPTQTETKSDE